MLRPGGQLRHGHARGAYVRTAAAADAAFRAKGRCAGGISRFKGPHNVHGLEALRANGDARPAPEADANGLRPGPEHGNRADAGRNREGRVAADGSAQGPAEQDLVFLPVDSRIPENIGNAGAVGQAQVERARRGVSRNGHDTAHTGQKGFYADLYASQYDKAM